MTRLTLAITISLFFAISPDRNAYSNEKDELPVLDKQAPDFILTDADNKYYELKEMAGSYVFMLFGNRSLRGENRKWAQALKDYYSQRTDIKIFMIADMKNIPFFITKNFIKEKISKESNPVPLLLDWGQKVSGLYNTDSKNINIFVIDPRGRIILYQKSNKYGQSEFDVIRARLESGIKSGGAGHDGQTGKE